MASTTAYRYWRLYITRVKENGVDGAAGNARVLELNLYTAANVKWPLSAMTADSTPSPYVASSTAITAVGREAYRAFDGLLGTNDRWLSGTFPAWLKIDLGSAVSLDRIEIVPDESAIQGGGYVLLDFQFQGSNTGAFAGEQEPVLTLINEVTGWTPNAARSYVLPPPSVIDVNGVLPAGVLDAGFGAVLEGTLPMGSLQADFGGRVDSTLPMGTLQANFGASLDGVLPVGQFDFVAHDSTGENSVDGTLPMGVLAANFGGWVSGTLPMGVLDAYATFTAIITVDGVLPVGVFDFAGTGTPYAITVDSVLPMGRLQADFGAWVDGVLPVGTLDASATSGASATVDGVLPRGVFDFYVTAGNTITVDGVLPMMVTVASVTVDGIMPVGVLDAYVTQVIVAAYEAYAVNLNHTLKPGDNTAPVDEMTRYTNFPFTHIVRYQNSYYGVAADGLYLLDGATDSSVAIPYAVKTCIDDLGAAEKKTISSAYFGGRLGPGATLTLTAGETGAQAYSFTTPRGALAQNHRQKFGKGVKNRYFALGVAGSGVMELDGLELDVDKLTRRI